MPYQDHGLGRMPCRREAYPLPFALDMLAHFDGGRGPPVNITYSIHTFATSRPMRLQECAKYVT